MAGETVITLVGNLTADVDLRFTPNGAAVANFTVASTPRTFDRRSNDFKDGETMFMRCAVWRDMAENAAESLSRGTRVIVQGRIKARSFETKEGDNRTVFEVDVDEVGPALRYATAQVRRNERGQGNSNGYGQRGGQEQNVHGAGNGRGTSQDDPWASARGPGNGHSFDGQFSGQGGNDWGGGSAQGEEPPF